MIEREPEGVALVVDDDEVFRNRLCRALADRGWDANGAGEGGAAIDLAAKSSPDLAVVDLRLPGMGGLDIVRELRKLDDTTCIIVLTGYGSIATALTATKLGANHYLSKPADADEILNAYEKVTGGAPETSIDTSLSVPSLARVEWEHIHRVLNDCGGNISQAAKLLGLHRRSLQRKLAKYPPRV
ncbi:MAG: response regulator [Acidobacteria bacterium]|nr:response regulator [Acidobacteriota bacterium]